jgi:hypothetical protein
MTRIRRRPCLLVLPLLLSTAFPAGAAFEELAVSPRARAMGEATVTVSGDAWAFDHNPALLALAQRGRIATSTVQPFGIDGLRLTGLGMSMPIPGDRGGAAFGYKHWSVDRGEVSLTTEQTLTFAHGITLFGDATSSAHVGWGLNVYNLEFGQTVSGEDPGSAWAWGLDVGAVVTLYERTRAGFFTRNLNSPTIGEDAEELRQLVAAGISYVPYDGVTTAFDVRSELGEEFRFHGGVEFSITSALDLRVGIESDPSKLTGGFGVHLPRYFSFDYGFSTGGGTLDSEHQFGLSIRLGEGGVGK